MSSSPDREPAADAAPEDAHSVGPAEPADWVKPVELIELLQRRTAKRKKIEAPSSSPFYDAEFVATHRTTRKKRHGSRG